MTQRIRAGAGVDTFHDLIDASVRHELGGLHHFVGIPSTVGGALWQNLHFLSPPPERERTCFIAEVLESATVLTATGDVCVVDNAWFRFAYDYSILHDSADIVLDATFRLEPTPVDTLRYVIRENLHGATSVIPICGSTRAPAPFSRSWMAWAPAV